MLDVSLFGATIPAGTYAVGDIVQLKCIDGPATVRSGRGAAYLKRITSGTLIGVNGSVTRWKVYTKNSDWIDPAINYTVALSEVTALDMQAGSVQDGQNCLLTPNSSWEVYAECVYGGTTTIDNSIFTTIDIDFPSVSSIVDPKTLQGYPTSISTKITSDLGVSDIEAAKWTVVNTDMFKAGYEYALVKPEMHATNASATGFLKLSNAAGMGGLNRIIPVSTTPANLRNNIEYASKLVKGPMDVSIMMFSTTGAAVTGSTVDVMLDFVKRRV